MVASYDVWHGNGTLSILEGVDKSGSSYWAQRHLNVDHHSFSFQPDSSTSLKFLHISSLTTTATVKIGLKTGSFPANPTRACELTDWLTQDNLNLVYWNSLTQPTQHEHSLKVWRVHNGGRHTGVYITVKRSLLDYCNALLSWNEANNIQTTTDHPHGSYTDWVVLVQQGRYRLQNRCVVNVKLSIYQRRNVI